MATKKASGVKAPKENEKKFEQQNSNYPTGNERQQYKVPYISAKIDRLSDHPESKIRAYASVTIGNHFAVHGLKIYDGGEKGPQVLYPATKGSDGKYYEDFHPVTKEAREAINGYVLEAYEQKLEQVQGEDQNATPADADLDEGEEPAFEQTM